MGATYEIAAASLDESTLIPYCFPIAFGSELLRQDLEIRREVGA